ncbi:DNA topoisomerase 3 [Flexibacterium corallicola]|uniref:DNA topoisomerase 3 n=1 Tax=Flexibacterium corallicola TaxID=3037259 RepID=UPI00286F7EB0|nr:DNA topoisomerase 3 [Pseudovibrio sp. M1P-2-3]
MITQLFIAEKPKMAASIAMVRGKMIGVSPQKQKTHWTLGDKEAVTWVFGHMYDTAPPESYDPKYKDWNLQDLPIIPSVWKRQPYNDKKSHLKAIQNLLRKATTVVNAGDPEREGQLLIDELLEELEYPPFSDKVYRLWAPSLAESDLRKALQSLFPNKEKEDLYKAALWRQRADWLHGLNMTRLYTGLVKRGGVNELISVGRVQTPTLKLVVDRDLQIANFQPKDYFVATGLFFHKNGSFSATYSPAENSTHTDEYGHILDRAVAEKILEQVKGKVGNILQIDRKRKTNAPPLPFSLSALQTECSNKFGLTAARTLEIAQSLYEKHRLTTYPRSDCRYLPLSIYSDQAAMILKQFQGHDQLKMAVAGTDISIKSNAWNDGKLSDHHAIIPTTDFSSAKFCQLSQEEMSVYLLISQYFLAQFYPSYQYEATKIRIKVENYNFEASGKRTLQQGWKVIFPASSAGTEPSLPQMSPNDPVRVDKTKVEKKTTKPPAPFNDGSLIAAMTNVYKYVPDSSAKKMLKDSDGIGTEATRANIIETLLKRDYVKREKKVQLRSTQHGRTVIKALPSDLKDPALTAIWEAQLTKISAGDAAPASFEKALHNSLHKFVQHGLQIEKLEIEGKRVPKIDGDGTLCPKCGKGTLRTRQAKKQKSKFFLACDNWSKDNPESCKHIQWPEVKIRPLKGDGQNCSKCQKGTMKTRQVHKGTKKGKRFLGCSNYPECTNSEWPD